MHAIEAQAHLRHLAGHVGNVPLDGAEPAPLLTLLVADLAQLGAYRPKVLQDQIGRVLAHYDNSGFSPAALQYCSS